jgi:hypothetical protein
MSGRGERGLPGGEDASDSDSSLRSRGRAFGGATSRSPLPRACAISWDARTPTAPVGAVFLWRGFSEGCKWTSPTIVLVSQTARTYCRECDVPHACMATRVIVSWCADRQNSRPTVLQMPPCRQDQSESFSYLTESPAHAATTSVSWLWWDAFVVRHMDTILTSGRLLRERYALISS